MRTLLFLFFLIVIPTTEIFASYGSIEYYRILTSHKTDSSALARVFRTLESLIPPNRLRPDWPERDGIYLSEVSDYISRKDELTAEFYDGLLIDYETDSGERNIGVAKIFHELEPDKIVVHGQTIDTIQINGVLVWNHRYYEQPVSIHIDDAIPISKLDVKDFFPDDEISRLYGITIGVFTSSLLAIDIVGFKEENSQRYNTINKAHKSIRKIHLAPVDSITFQQEDG